MVEKLCKFCKHFKVHSNPYLGGTDNFQCAHPNNTVKDMVFGGEDFKYGPYYLRITTNIAEEFRDEFTLTVCGPEGLWFEPTPYVEDK